MPEDATFRVMGFPDGSDAGAPARGSVRGTDADGWHHVDPSGIDAYRQRYAFCGNFQGGRCVVREPDGDYRHITAAGELAYAERFRYVGDFRDGIAVVQGEDGRSTHIDRDGGRVHGRWFLDLDVFHKGFARARDDDGWMHIDIAGNPRYTRRFAAVEPFYNGQARVERFDGGLEVIDETGFTLIELRPALRSEFAALSADMVGFWRTQTIATSIELGLFEALPGSVEDVAARCRLRPDRTRRLLLPSTGTRTIRGARCRCPTIAGASIATPRPTAVPTPIPSGRASTLAVARSGAVTRTRRTRTPTTRALGPIPRTRTGTPTTRALGAIAFSAARAFAPEARAAGALTRAEAPASTLAGVRGTALAATATASATPRASRPTRAGDRGSTPTQQSKAQARGSSNYSDSMLRDVRHLPTLGTDL